MDSELDAAAWALAFVLCPSATVVEQLTDEFDALVSGLTTSTRNVMLSASARVGVAGTARRLPRGTIGRGDLSPAGELMLTHQLDLDDQQAVFPDQLKRGQAMSMARLGAPAWPIHLAAWNAVTARHHPPDRPNRRTHDEELGILRTAGPGIVLPAVGAGMLTEHESLLVVEECDLYPWAAIQAAGLTLGRVNAHAHAPLGAIAVQGSWFED